MVKILFPLVMALLFFAIHFLGYSRIVKHLHVKPQTQTILKILLIINYFGILAYLASRYFLYIPSELYFIFSLCIGVGFVILMGIIFYELLHIMQKNVPLDKEKRAFFKRSSDIGFLSLGAAYMSMGVYEGSKTPALTHIKVNQNRLKKAITIAQISDMHIGGLIDQEFVAQSVAQINAQKPDLVVITGDLTDAPIATLKDAVDELQNLKSPLGTFYIVGNHEYFHGIKETIAYIKSIGITVLENSALKLDDFYICGVYDIFGHRYGSYEPDIDKTMQSIPKDAPSLLLVHQPRFLSALGTHKPSLILSGHTHGGQIWPFEHLVKLVQPYVKGLHVIGKNRHIYVNSGIGFWGPPMRLGSQAEITIIKWS
ncbi:MAG: metallophosphoesterase [Campylobacterota bacterium]|nr:metallophosphoesterase [Campylobacterota bacterium]